MIDPFIEKKILNHVYMFCKELQSRFSVCILYKFDLKWVPPKERDLLLGWEESRVRISVQGHKWVHRPTYVATHPKSPPLQYYYAASTLAGLQGIPSNWIASYCRLSPI